MKTTYDFGLLALLALTLAPAPRAGAQNLLANPGFEDPVTYDGAPFVGSWEAFSGGPGASAANAAANPRTGASHLDLNIANTDNTFAGVFQDVPVTPGRTYTLAGWNRTPSSPLDLDAEVRIEWRSAAADAEVARTPNLNPLPGPAYAPFALTATAPANADLARVVYAIQTFTGGPTNNGQVFVDDLSFAAVPEPGAVVLIGFSGIGALRRSRRHRP